jgi:hypothetical protein
VAPPRIPPAEPDDGVAEPLAPPPTLGTACFTDPTRPLVELPEPLDPDPLEPPPPVTFFTDGAGTLTDVDGAVAEGVLTVGGTDTFGVLGAGAGAGGVLTVGAGTFGTVTVVLGTLTVGVETVVVVVVSTGPTLSAGAIAASPTDATAATAKTAAIRLPCAIRHRGTSKAAAQNLRSRIRR